MNPNDPRPDSWLVRSGLALARTPENSQQFSGVPDWASIGILLLWAVRVVVTAVFTLIGMEDDDLGPDVEGPSASAVPFSGHDTIAPRLR